MPHNAASEGTATVGRRKQAAVPLQGEAKTPRWQHRSKRRGCHCASPHLLAGCHARGAGHPAHCSLPLAAQLIQHSIDSKAPHLAAAGQAAAGSFAALPKCRRRLKQRAAQNAQPICKTSFSSKAARAAALPLPPPTAKARCAARAAASRWGSRVPPCCGQPSRPADLTAAACRQPVHR